MAKKKDYKFENKINKEMLDELFKLLPAFIKKDESLQWHLSFKQLLGWVNAMKDSVKEKDGVGFGYHLANYENLLDTFLEKKILNYSIYGTLLRTVRSVFENDKSQFDEIKHELKD